MNEKFEGTDKDVTRNDVVMFTRHSKAMYGEYANVVGGETPEQPMDYEDQPLVDLTEAGVNLAHEKARELLSSMNAETDALFFATSPERRAIDTANIYREEARTLGFEIFSPEHVRGNLAEDIGEGELRVLETLSTRISNVLVSTVFNPGKLYRPESINWGAVTDETKQKFDEARSIITADDKGSWGANFTAHSEEIARLFPDDLKSAQKLYDTQFKNLIRLARFGVRKARESGLEKNVKVLAFGHENYIGAALEKYFHDQELLNCETLNIDIDDETINMTRRGEKIVIEE
jgi:hypothetical protein